MSAPFDETDERLHPDEPHAEGAAARLNWLRAGVLGANDGIVSVAGLVLGVAGVSNDHHPALVAGVAGIVSGAFSMALGEYVSVSTQADTEKALIEKERRELEEDPELELEELTRIYEAKGLRRELAEEVARELTEHDALAAHAEAELRLDKEETTSPVHAAVASFLAFGFGGILPVLTIFFLPTPWNVWGTLVAVGLALAVAGYVSAVLGHAPRTRAVLRLVVGGAVAMLGTYLVGMLFGTTVA